MLKPGRYGLSSCIRRCGEYIACALLLCTAVAASHAQTNQHSFFEPADSFDNTRFWVATGTAAAAYTATVIGLNEIWYKQYERTGFHVQNDWGEWENVDKMGHMFTAYMYSKWVADVSHWTGIKRETADWVGFGTSMLFQTTIEIMDGHSEKWGFSWVDMGFNAAGAGLYLGQQKLWGEQRIMMKFSSTPVSYSNYEVVAEDGESIMTLQQRADDLYGTGFFETLLKDYNAQTIWTSVNVHSFLRDESKFPKWLNVAFGFGAYNMYGGYSNSWEKDGANYVLSDDLYPRYNQYYLTLDVDLTRIKTKSPFVRALLGALNVIKVPFPAVEFNSVDGVKFHALKF